ncbi:hypothetical protein KIN20_013772 [Parelaphostrongylus tenuis]|uniref:Uncharacterized protein n=1 Tax=Parelaphostrongylus tenuis TaxID=148309 RepID=A0AAD5MWK6_PARTN|nr:hypothetical protein KIN20_013772 [Parelaphostrongylus tenuis]
MKVGKKKRAETTRREGGEATHLICPFHREKREEEGKAPTKSAKREQESGEKKREKVKAEQRRKKRDQKGLLESARRENKRAGSAVCKRT